MTSFLRCLRAWRCRRRCRKGHHAWVKVYLQETDDFSVPWWGCDRKGCMARVKYFALWPHPQHYREERVDMKHWWFKEATQ